MFILIFEATCKEIERKVSLIRCSTICQMDLVGFGGEDGKERGGQTRKTGNNTKYVVLGYQVLPSLV